MINLNRMTCRVVPDIWGNISRLYLSHHERKDGDTFVKIQQFGKSIILKEGDSYVNIPSTLALQTSEMNTLLQEIVDEAWQQGIRPTALSANQIEYKAQERHLEDMRTLVFKGKQP